jgi:Domain of unknown function (DUF5659)
MSKGNGNGNGEIRTSDLYFAAYLQTAGVPMKRTERATENGKVYFVFDTTIANIEELKTAWFNNSGKVAANPYAYNVKSLKALCHLK